MNEQSATLHDLLQDILPSETRLLVGSPQLLVGWAVTIRARPPAFPEIYGGELALVSMKLIHSYDSRIKLEYVIANLAEVGVTAIAVKGEVVQEAIDVAETCGVSLLLLPQEVDLKSVERDINKYILSQSARLTQRAIDIQRELSRLAAENRDLKYLLRRIVHAIAKPICLHDETGQLIEQVYPKNCPTQTRLQSSDNGILAEWLHMQVDLDTKNSIISSPIGFTIVLKVEKRIAGYLSLVTEDDHLKEFDRLVMTYSGDVCAIELAKNRAIASAVEQVRGDWIQMWLSGTSTDDDLLISRAQQVGFEVDSKYIVAIFKLSAPTDDMLPIETLMSQLRDDMNRRQINGAVGQYAGAIVALYPAEMLTTERMREIIEEKRQQLIARNAGKVISVGMSRPVYGVLALRDAHNEAKNALIIADELGDSESTTYYGDLKLYQLLLAVKDQNLEHLRRFYDESLALLVEHDERRQGELIITLNGFFNANGNLAKAANDLNVHRNTLVYRLERISELTNLDLNDPENRLILHLALKIQRVLATIPTC